MAAVLVQLWAVEATQCSVALPLAHLVHHWATAAVLALAAPVTAALDQLLWGPEAPCASAHLEEVLLSFSATQVALSLEAAQMREP